MNKMMRVVKGTGKVILAILTGIFMPILLWIGLGVALNQKMRAKKRVTETAPTIGEILDGAQTELEKMLK
jgi:hypothetical protein